MSLIKYRSTEEKKTKKITYILVFYLIYATDSLFLSTNINFILPKISQYIIVGLSIVLFTSQILKKRISVNLAISIIMSIVLIFSMLINNDITNGYYLKISLFILSIVIWEIYDAKTMIKKYIHIMQIIAIVSLIGFLFGKIIAKLDALPTIVNILGREYTSLIFTNIPKLAIFQTRNWGPFWEPGVFQAYLVMALIFTLYYYKKNQRVNIIIFSITIVTTFSTTGIIALFLVFMSYLFEQNQMKKNVKILIFALLAASILFLFFNDNVFNSIFGKIKMGTESASFSSRWNSVGSNLYTLSKNPIFGVGPNQTVALVNEYLATVQQTGKFYNVNTILVHFSNFGFIIGSYFCYRIYKFCNAMTTNKLSILIILIAIIALLSGENLVYSLFFNIIFGLNIKCKDEGCINEDSLVMQHNATQNCNIIR